MTWSWRGRGRLTIVSAVGVVVLASMAALAVVFHAPPKTPDPAPSGPLLFADCTDDVRLRFTHDAGPVSPNGPYFMPQIMGSGAAVFDFDGDGRAGIYLLNNGGPKGRPNQLFRQRTDGTFEDVSRGSGLDFAGFCMGVAIGDVNNDGRPDVLVTTSTGQRLFLNEGGGRFRDVTQEAGLDSPLWGMSAAFFDYDRDGRLDLIVVNYLEYDPTRVCTRQGQGTDYCPPRSFAGQVATLYRNLGPAAGKAVVFRDTTLAAGLAGRGSASGSCAPTSPGTAGPTSSSPTMPTPTSCGSTGATARSPRRRCPAASPTTSWASSKRTWALRWATWMGTGYSTCS
jgi:enediyne biosynthesis protein E4